MSGEGRIRKAGASEVAEGILLYSAGGDKQSTQILQQGFHLVGIEHRRLNQQRRGSGGHKGRVGLNSDFDIAVDDRAELRITFSGNRRCRLEIRFHPATP